MADDAHQAVVFTQRLQRTDGKPKQVFIQRAKAFIDKEDIKLDAALLCLDFIRHAKGEGHAGQECFATGAGSRRRSVPLT